MADVLLINSPVRNAAMDQHASLGPPLGLAYIAAVLMQHGYRPSAVDLNISGLNPDRVRAAIEMAEPGILGISTHTETYLSGLEVARIAKALRPSLPVVMGGPHSTVMYQEVIREDCVDYVVRGEGELTMLELTDLLLKGEGTAADIEGLVYKDAGGVHVTPDRPFIEDPDMLPFPARGLFPLDLYPVQGNVLTSRGGCPFNCDFCAVNNIWHSRRRHRNPEMVVEEIRRLMRDSQLQEIVFADDTFTLNPKHVLRLCALLEPMRIPWKCATRADLVDQELLSTMASAGCNSVQYGVEAGSQEILDLIGKGITLDQVREAVRTALDVGMDVLCSFMFPHPADTMTTVRAQKDFMKELAGMGARVSMSYTSPYPGTVYYEHADELGIRILSDSWDDFNAKHLNITTRHLSKEQLTLLSDEIADEVRLHHR